MTRPRTIPKPQPEIITCVVNAAPLNLKAVSALIWGNIKAAEAMGRKSVMSRKEGTDIITFRAVAKDAPAISRKDMAPKKKNPKKALLSIRA